jgi:hypothetical protein
MRSRRRRRRTRGERRSWRRNGGFAGKPWLSHMLLALTLPTQTCKSAAQIMQQFLLQVSVGYHVADLEYFYYQVNNNDNNNEDDTHI